jgi:hypothetical protein
MVLPQRGSSRIQPSDGLLLGQRIPLRAFTRAFVFLVLFLHILALRTRAIFNGV